MTEQCAIQQRLNRFYADTLQASKFDSVQQQELSLPLLLSVPQAFLKAPVRIMFVGKETNGWLGKLAAYYSGCVGIADLLGRYDRQMQQTTARGAFSRMHQRLADALAGGRKEAVLWNNLSKMDWHQGRPDSRTSLWHSAALREFSQKLLRFEVDLLQPDVMVFGTGPSYDMAIKETFPLRTDSLALVPRALWRFRVGNAMCLRMQHPQSRAKVQDRSVGSFYEEAFSLIQAANPLVLAHVKSPRIPGPVRSRGWGTV